MLLTSVWPESIRLGGSVNIRTNGVESHASDGIRVTKIADALTPEELPPLVFAPSGAETEQSEPGGMLTNPVDTVDSFGDPNEQALPVVNSAPLRRRSPVEGGSPPM